MKTRSSHFKSVLLVGVLSAVINFAEAVQAQAKPDAPTAAKPQSPAGGPSPLFDFDIENHRLIVTNLNPRVNVEELWGKGSLHSVPADIDNLVKYLRAADKGLNIIVAPEAHTVPISELKLRSADINNVMESIGFATAGLVRGASFGGPRNWTLMTARTTRRTDRSVEVFNLTGYIHHLLTVSSAKEPEKEAKVTEALGEIQTIILGTLVQLRKDKVPPLRKDQPSNDELPEFKFHRGTGLFIVTGPPQAIEVARKVVNALPGQPRPGGPDLLDITVPKEP